MVDGEVCGSIRVLATEGSQEAKTQWCDREAGPCPYAGAPESSISERHCPAGRRFKVTYGDDRLDDALRDLDRAHSAAQRTPGVLGPHAPADETFYIAKACLKAALGIEDG